MEKEKVRIHILPQIYYDDFLKKINVIWVSQYLFRNGNDYFLIFNSKLLLLKHTSFMFQEIRENEILDFTIMSNEKYSQTISILNNLHNEYDTDVMFYFPTLKMYSFLTELYCQYFGIKTYFHKIISNYQFNEQLLNIIGMEKEYIEPSIIKEQIILKHLNDKVFSFFSSNTTITHSIDLLYLMIDSQLKNLKSNYCVKINDTQNNKSIVGFKTFSLSEPKHFKNIYLYLNFERELFFVNNPNTYQQLNSKVIEYNSENYFLKDSLDSYDEITNANKSLEELYIPLENYYFSDEIYYKLMQFYEIVVLNESNEIVDYNKINLNFDLFTYIESLILQKNDKSFLTDKLNNVTKILKMNYKEQSKPIAKCPYCFEGNIYKNDSKFFCFNCNFFISIEKTKEKYGITLTKRHLKILLRKKYIILPYHGENRAFFIYQSDKDYYWLTMLRKWH